MSFDLDYPAYQQKMFAYNKTARYDVIFTSCALWEAFLSLFNIRKFDSYLTGFTCVYAVMKPRRLFPAYPARGQQRGRWRNALWSFASGNIWQSFPEINYRSFSVIRLSYFPSKTIKISKSVLQDGFRFLVLFSKENKNKILKYEFQA